MNGTTTGAFRVDLHANLGILDSDALNETESEPLSILEHDSPLEMVTLDSSVLNNDDELSDVLTEVHSQSKIAVSSS